MQETPKNEHQDPNSQGEYFSREQRETIQAGWQLR